MKAFKAYDIRGIYGQDFDQDDAYKIGFFLPELLNVDRVLVGHDARETSDEIFNALSSGITDKGADVYYIGLSTTPMVYFTTANYEFPASVQITASHNPKDYNGFKISKSGALPVGYETGLAELEALIKEGQIKKESNKGHIKEYYVKNKYIKFLKKYVPDINDLSLSIDCSNGMASLLIKDVLGDEPHYLYDRLDGTFPNHEPNPLIEENVEDLKKQVLENNDDIGIIFDGDADRVMFVNEKGEFISPDLIIALMADYFLNNEKEIVLHDIRTSKSVSEYIQSKNAETYMWKVGHAYAKRKLREINGIYGGELAGHYYFRDFFYCDSGIMAALIVLNVVNELKKKGISVSRYIEKIKKYSYSGEINFQITEKKKAMEDLKNYFVEKEEPVNIYDFDGYRIEFKDWWFNVRPSNTEPYLRLVVEAENDKLLENKLKNIKNKLKKY